MRSRSHFYFLLTSALIIGLALWARVTDLYRLPIFPDEGDHMSFALGFQRQLGYPLLMDGKFLLGVLVGLFPLWGPAPLWVARCVVALSSMLSVAACIALGAQSFSRRVGLLAGLIYAGLPYAVYFERQFLADPLMAAFGSGAIFLTVVFARERRWRTAWWLGGALAAAFFAKLFGGVYGLVLPVAALTLTTRRHIWSSVRRYIGAGLIALIIGLGFTALMYPRLGDNNARLQNQNVGFIACPAVVCQGSLTQQWAQLVLFGDVLTQAVRPYLGWPLVLLAGAALFFPAQRRHTVFLWLSTLAMMSVFAVSAKGGLPPRYLMFLVTPLVVLAAQGMIQLGRLGRQPLIAAALFGVAVSTPFANSALIIFSPAQARLAPIDVATHFTGQVGPGVSEALALLTAGERQTGKPPIIIVDKLRYLSVMPYIDQTRINLRNTQYEHDALAAGDVLRWLREPTDIYILAEVNPDGSLHEAPDPFVAQLLTETAGVFPKVSVHNESLVSVRRVVGLNAALSKQIFANDFLAPHNFADQYRALVDRLGAAETKLVVYPPHQQEALAAAVGPRTTIQLQPIGETLPLDAVTADRALTAAVVGHNRIGVVFLDEARGDAARYIETWLNTHLFRIEEQWFGAVRLITYAADTNVSQPIQAAARVGTSMALDSYEVLDTQVKAGELIRIRLQWRALAPLTQQFKVFLHLFSGETMVAQHDGQPMGELRPTTTWRQDEVIVDQFALRLPPDLPAGRYRLRVGMYDMVTQQRLPIGPSDVLVFDTVIEVK